MPFALSGKTDRAIDEVLAESFNKEGLTIWRNGDTDVYLPSPENHIILVFTHFLHHFFIEGVGLRQICDWCRLLWGRCNSLDRDLLEIRIRKMGLMSEWKAFAAVAVDWLGMPVEAMPLYNDTTFYKKKAKRILKRVISTGNMGHNNDVSYRAKYSPFIYNVITFFRRFQDFIYLSFIFPIDAPRFFGMYVINRIQ